MTIRSAEEDPRRLLEEFNLTDNAATLGSCFPWLFEQAAHAHFDRTAVICGDAQLTYGTLNGRANIIAQILVNRNIGSGDVVGVALDRSVDLLVVLLAVMKSGAAYVPIDPALPAQRILQMMNDTAPKVVLTDHSVLDTLSLWNGPQLSIEELRVEMSLNPANTPNIRRDIQPEDLAYVIYTSGSTGKPKGVEISHGAVANFVLSMQVVPGCNKHDRILAVSTISFDMTLWDLYAPLACGACTVIAQTHEQKDAEALIELIRENGITSMLATPATWQMLFHAGWQGQPRLKTIKTGGESLSQHLSERLLAAAEKVYNGYGPTEATGCVSLWPVQAGEEVLIGTPIANTKLYVLDADLSPMPLGCAGELYIGGAGVACGYRNNPELTRSRFLANPFHEGLMYRTGDLACLVTPKKLKFLGRADSQVKIRGQRLELGEVEAAITSHGDVAHAIVINREGQLAAYCVRDLHRAVEIDPAKVSLSSILRPWLVERLPAYMVPSFIMEVDHIPLTLNGKVDHKSLPAPMAETTTTNQPATELERDIAAIWSTVLGHDHIGRDDNFFQIGGDSVRLVRMQADLKKLLGRSVPITVLFQQYTIKSLAGYLMDMDRPIPADESIHQPNPKPHHVDSDDIAVVSMACRLPGGIETPEAFWELLERGGDATTDVPPERWDADALYDPDPDAPGKSYCRRGGFVPSFGAFDTKFFHLLPNEARALDPAQYIMLETSWEAFERAGYRTQQLRGSSTGVFIGVNNTVAHGSPSTHAHGLADLQGYTGTGTAGGTMSGRVSYVLGLEGPSLTIDTACSSSLVATHLACTALRQGECDMAVTGAVTHLPAPGLHVEFSRLRGVAPDGRCRAFAADAQGIGIAEGAAVVVLKRLSDARRDGDTIYGVLRGSAVNHGGQGAAGLTVPSGAAQERVIRAALASSRLLPDDIDYIEAHGTGTRLGDPIEGMALTEVFGGSRSNTSQSLWIGSSKTNVGHTQAAAGLVGLIKVLLALRYNTLPPTLHITQPTPAIDWHRANMAPVQTKQHWLAGGERPRRAGVSSFGIGGTNAHVIVEEPPRCSVSTESTLYVPLPHPVPFLLSSPVEAGLQPQADKLHMYLSQSMSKGDPGNIAYSLATTRNHFPQRIVLLAQDTTDLVAQLVDLPRKAIVSPRGSSPEPRLAMLFAGQGSQQLGRGKTLAKHYRVFRETLEEIATQFYGILQEPLLDVMHAAADSALAALLQRSDYAQPALFALEVALWRLWQSWGVQPDMVLGHSIGELTAAHIAGVMDLPDACRLVAARGRLMETLPCHGGMASLEASASEVSLAITTLDLGGQVGIAAYNTPSQTVISGDRDALDILIAYFSGQDRQSKTLPVSRAFHSHHIDGMLTAYQAVVQSVQLNAPSLPIVSTLTGRRVEPCELQQPTYWVRQAREAVRYSDGIQALADHGMNVFLELGPQSVLCGMGAAVLDGSENRTTWLPSLAPNKDEVVAIQEILARLHVQHVPVNWQGYFQPFGCRRLELPTYAFQRERVHSGTKERDHGKREARPQASAFYDKVFQIDWRPFAIQHVQPRGIWGLQCSSGYVKWAEAVRAALFQGGIQCILLPSLSLQGTKTLDGVLCLWDSHGDVISQVHEFAAQGLTQLKEAANTRPSLPLVWLTSQAVGTARDDQPLALGAGLLWGLMRTARNEHPERSLRLIDLGRDDQNRVDASGLAPLLMLHTEPECALRQGMVLVPRMQRMELEFGDATQTLLRSDGAVLITGGLSGLGARIAEWLASTHGIRDLVLTSRRGMDTPGAATLVRRLAHLGTKTTVVSGDTTDPSHLNSLLSMFSHARPLRGVVHAAGVRDTSMLGTSTPQRCVGALAPKVIGAWYLHQFTRTRNDLDLFVVVSSFWGVMGTSGHATDAAANAVLDSLVYTRQSQGLPAVCVAYGPLPDINIPPGLLPTIRDQLQQMGIKTLTPDDTISLFELAARRSHGVTVAAALDLHQLQSYSSQRGGIPALLRLLLDRDTPQKHQGPALYDVLRRTAPDQRREILLRTIQEAVATTLGFSQPDEVDIHRSLPDMGIDSLGALLVRNQLAGLLGQALPANIVFIHPSLDELSRYLLPQLVDSNRDASSVAEPDMASASTAADVSGLNLMAIRKGCVDSSFTFDNALPKPTPQSVFVTGATEFVGAFLVHELLDQGKVTYCLVHAHSIDHARQQIVSWLQDYNLWKIGYAELLRPLVGDVCQVRLGLDESVFDDLAHRVDTIYHASCLVDWMRPLDDYIGPNVTSTHEVLRLASTSHAKTIHYLSTSATLPYHLGYDIPEDALTYGYAMSKLMAERMVIAARCRGAQAFIYRLPFITASATSGHFQLNNRDFLHNLISGSLEMGCFPSLDADLSLVFPVDYVCRTIITLAHTTPGSTHIRYDYDFKNPQAQSFDHYFNLLATVGKDLESLAFSTWRQRALAYAAAKPASSLTSIADILKNSTEEAVVKMFQCPPIVTPFLGGEEFPVPSVNDQSVRKYLHRMDLTL
ncbi:polyketide synthase [Aspergillus candidus]|uniref:PKS-NRPS hybrid synthetase acdB n=1 Tax=Aspergillus candidus TaxID=41067 RepID=ACDB_ASPCN|nr:polyketide synthase [Aspergillus candidus]A0A2I2F262.1 RecName: Full=PKS-NRPS hybrid synthetase acdB; AltName: Full=Aspcandine biosynthesis gene cluster protein B [Aspergillus candidus]PLB34720.1 polyketide synthase [Aspergillus candidus]